MSGLVRSYKRALIFSCMVVVLSLTALPSSANGLVFKSGSVDAGAEQEFLAKTNSLRRNLGLSALRSNSELLAKARSWSQTQASAGTIFHSTLTDGVTQNWHRLGENVGMGPDVGAIHDALVRSPRHYENLADTGFTEVGIGVVRQGNTIYVTQVFMELMPTSNAPSSPATTAAPRSTPRKAATPAVAAATKDQAVEAVAAPLKTASPDLTATVKRISELES